MPKYDAFGREIGENTLSGLGGDATAQPSPTPTPEVSESWESAATAATAAPAAKPADGWTEKPAPESPILRGPEARPKPVRVRRAGPYGCFFGLVFLAVILAGPIIAVVSIVGSASDTIDEVTGALDDIPTIDPPDVPDAPPPPPVGITGKSMIAPANFAAVLKDLRGDDVKSVVRITIWPERLRADAVKGRRERDVEYRFDGGVSRGDPSQVNRAVGTVPLPDIDPRVPVRLVKNSAKRFRVRERGINYLIVSHDVFSGSGHQWIAYFKNGTYVEGDERGRVVRRLN